ncbi:MAG TPA: pectinesterase family protein [Nitrospirales bacterium]|nr:pectinesterase family protein [Nitrospirales bacterium]
MRLEGLLKVACPLFAVVLSGGAALADSASAGRVVVVAQDGSGAFSKIQEAIDSAKPGDTIVIKAGKYHEDVVVHSKDRLRLVGESRDKVTILGLKRVGAFRIGKWPYGANDIEIRDLTVSENGGLAVGIFNGSKILLTNIRVQGQLYVQQAQDVRIEKSLLGGSETTGVSFADAQGEVVGNEIRDNDHGVTVTGKSDVRIEGNVIANSLYEAVVFQAGSKGAVVGNRLIKNGGGIVVHDGAHVKQADNAVASAP